ncbi:kinase-like protein [Exidia glandulosa HHB12029]|uniref:non-specific serine/threonine protein kinase n=1 Tax=Exidia glandulosa HHB12029 TaxID=1314781 RepID=A0A165JNY2_EXIGL|nr:kinase-like protein [Exidia glandulosa HHB12029]
MKLFLNELVGSGGFSRVYAARVIATAPTTTKVTKTTTGALIAVKKMHITKHAKNSVLRHEACAYLLLAGHPCVPEVYAWGRSQYYDYLALELLGEDVLLVQDGLTQYNFVVIATAMLDALEHVHSRGLIHCDVKPNNFLFSSASGPGHQLKLIDFGLAVPFRDLHTGAHLPEGSTSHMRGTARYASIQSHMFRRLGRRDDIESLAYTLIELAGARLPWAKCHNDRDILRRKTVQGCPVQPLAKFLAYACDLPFAAEPNYAHWRTAFRELVPSMQDGAVFDPADDGPRVAEWRSVDRALEEVPKSQSDSPPALDASSDSDSIPDSDDGWFPTSSWAAPVSVRESDLIGDEQATVHAQLDHIEEPPAMAQEWLLHFHSPEKMQDF